MSGKNPEKEGMFLEELRALFRKYDVGVFFFRTDLRYDDTTWVIESVKHSSSMDKEIYVEIGDLNA